MSEKPKLEHKALQDSKQGVRESDFSPGSRPFLGAADNFDYDEDLYSEDYALDRLNDTQVGQQTLTNTGDSKDGEEEVSPSPLLLKCRQPGLLIEDPAPDTPGALEIPR